MTQADYDTVKSGEPATAVVIAVGIATEIIRAIDDLPREQT